MKIIVEDRRRFLTALIVSALFHGVLLLVLGFWSLKIPSSPELPPPLTVTITPETTVAEKSIVQQKTEKAEAVLSSQGAAEEKLPAKAPGETTEPRPQVQQKPAPKTVNTTPAEPKPDPVTMKAPAEEDTDSQFFKDLAKAQASTVPVPPRNSSEIV